MENKEIPIKEFRAHTAEVLRIVAETKTAYVITNRGQPVADVVPHGTAVRAKAKSWLGGGEAVYDHGWDNVPLQLLVNMEHKVWTTTEEEFDKEMDELYRKYNPGPG